MKLIPLVLSFAAFVIFSLAVPPIAESPNLKRVAKSNGTVVAQQEKTAKTPQKDSEQATAAPNSAIGEAPTKNLKADTPEADKNIQVQRKLVWLTALLVVAAFIAGGVVGWQSWETRKSANAASDAARTARSNTVLLISKERARVWVDWVKLQLVGAGVRCRGCPREPDRIEFQVLCSGATDAFVEDSGIASWVGSSADFEKEAVFFPFPLPKIVSPSKNHAIYSEPIDPLIDQMIEESPAQEGQRASFFLHFAVHIKYMDVFQTHTCWQMECQYTWTMTHHASKDGGFFSWTEYAHRDDEKEVEKPD